MPRKTLQTGLLQITIQQQKWQQWQMYQSRFNRRTFKNGFLALEEKRRIEPRLWDVVQAKTILNCEPCFFHWKPSETKSSSKSKYGKGRPKTPRVASAAAAAARKKEVLIWMFRCELSGRHAIGPTIWKICIFGPFFLQLVTQNKRTKLEQLSH